MSFEDLLEEIIKSFKESSEKKIQLNTDKDTNKIDIKRNPELVYGLRNFIGNAVKFANQNIIISIINFIITKILIVGQKLCTLLQGNYLYFLLKSL